MSDELLFEVTFHTPFRVGTGGGDDGVDEVIDPLVPVPGTSIKGVMREASRVLLPATHDGEHPLMCEVFGDERNPSPWHWDDIVPAVEITQRSRIRIGSHGTVAPGALLVAEEASATSGQLRVWRSAPVEADRVRLHRAILALSARLIDGLGADRRRGLGWVGLTGPDVTATDLALIRKAATP